MSVAAGVIRDPKAEVGRLDWLLRFDAPIRDRYEEEHREERVASIRSSVLFGLIVYNIYNLTSITLMPDIFWLSVALRVLVVTPISLALVCTVGRLSASPRELLVLNAMTGAYLVPLFLFWLTRSPYGSYTYGELPLSLVFGNMLLALRFRHAVAFTALVLVSTTVAVLTKPDLDPALRAAFVIQCASACIITLYANHRLESRRCRDYLIALEARLVSEVAEDARRQFRDLSETDALTGLPNRRYLDDVLDDWLVEPCDLAILMIDIDHFKLFNDALGHPAGDDCLRAVAAALRETATRPGGFAARFGGEEFTCVARDVSPFEAARLARNLVTAVSALAIPHPSRSDGLGVVTASVGVALTSRTASTDRPSLLAEADAALYEAKRNGRNCFALAAGRRGALSLSTGRAS